MDGKYRLPDKTYEYRGVSLHRIQAIQDFGRVKVGALGGWVESENNLYHNGTCWVYDGAIVCDSAVVMDSAVAMGAAKVMDSAVVCESSTVCGSSIIAGNARIKSNAYVKDTIVDGKVVIGKNGYITNGDSYFAVENIGSRHDTTTFYLDKDKTIWVTTGCFNDTLEAFERAVIETHGDNTFARQYLVAIQLAKVKLL